MHVNVRLLAGQAAALLVILALALFLSAGTLAWPAGWAYLVLFFGFYLSVNAWLFKYNPGLLEERLHLGAANQQGWDRLFFPLLAALPVLMLVVAALDAVRFHWSPVAPWLQVVGAGLLLGSFYLFFLTFRENSYLSPVVRLQRDRGHTVIATGPYHYVRHPMYTGIVAFAVGTPLLLGSAYGVLCGLILVLLVARRAVLEERTLCLALPGYAAYAAQVRYRFIPHVW